MEEKDPGRPRRREIEVPGLSPVRAFFVVCAIATIVGGGLFATRDASPTEAPAKPAPSPDFSLTDAEAIARFEELHALFRAASKNRDESLLKSMLTADSPLQVVARRQIHRLLHDAVLDESRFGKDQIQIVENSASRIEIEQTVVIHPRFVSEVDHDEVSGGTPLRQVIKWVLMLDGSVWKVHDSEVLSSRRVR